MSADKLTRTADELDELARRIRSVALDLAIMLGPFAVEVGATTKAERELSEVVIRLRAREGGS